MDRKKAFESNLTEVHHGIRPTDVPGRILNMALLNIGSEDPSLRSAAYSLLCSLCISFRFGIDHKLMNARGNFFFFFFNSPTFFSTDLCIPANSVDFIVNMSENLASSETHLTLEFLNECILGFNRSSTETSRQLLTLDYMVPWLKNLVLFILVPHGKNPPRLKKFFDY